LYLDGKSRADSASLGGSSKWQIGLSISPSSSTISDFYSGSRFWIDTTRSLALLFSTSVGENLMVNTSSQPAAIDPTLGPTV
jgi:hypothetical protein